MRLSRVALVLLIVGLALFIPLLCAQEATQDLPSAPSAATQKAQPPSAASESPSSPTEPSPDSGKKPPSSGDSAAAPTEPAADHPQKQGASFDAAPRDETSGSKPPAAASANSDPTPTPDAKASAQDDSIATIRKTVNEVNVVFTVTDRHGRYVKDLTKQDFKVIDDNKPPDEIRSFHSETDLPLMVGLLIDASNSVRDRFKFEQEAAVEFLNQTIRRKYDKAFVVGFDVTPEITQDFTDDTEALSVGVRSLRPGGGTAMYDALYFACRDKLLKAPQTGPARKAIILLSDGEDNQSHVTREEAIEMAQRADTVVYTISTNLTGSSHHGDKILERIAEATGGRSYVPFQLTEVANAFASIQEELRSQYAISYKPADFRSDGRYRSIEILAQEKGLHVRSRHGYYAPSQ